MKKLLYLAFLLAFGSLNAQSTGFLIGGGYTIGVYNHLEGLNQAVKNYNSTRPWLTNKMGEFGNMQGVVFDMTGYVDHFTVKLGWTGNHQTNSATGIAPGTGKLSHRELKVQNNVVNFGFGFGTKVNRVGFFIGTTLNLGFAPQYTRIWDDGDKAPEFQKIPLGDNIDIGMSLSPEILFKITKGIFFDIKPYYELNFENYSFVEVESDLNHSYQYNFDEAPFKCRPNHYGIDIKIMFGTMPETNR